MKVVLAAFSIIIAISWCNASRKKPNIDVFEISENQLTKKLQVQPVKLQYDLESDEKDSKPSVLSNLLLAYKKKKIQDTAKDIIKNIQKDLKLSEKKQKQSIMMIVSPEYLDILDSHYHSDQDSTMSSFLDKTRTHNLLKPGSDIVYNIVPPIIAKKSLKQKQLVDFLRNREEIEDRTAPPRWHYVYDDENDS